MNTQNLTNDEWCLRLAHGLRDWRISATGAGLSQVALARLSGIGLTPLKRFEKTGAITLRNLVALLRALKLLAGLDALLPAPATAGPLERLAAARAAPARRRAPRQPRAPDHA